jgi:hypothetical protein
MSRGYEPSPERLSRDCNVRLPVQVTVGNDFIDRVVRLEASLGLLERAHGHLAHEVGELRKALNRISNGGGSK